MDAELTGQVPAVSAPEAAPVAQVAPGVTTPEPAETPNQEAAKYRTQLREAERRLKQLEADAKARQDADLSDLQKAQKRLAELEAAQATATARAKAAELRAAGLTLGSKLGVPQSALPTLVKLLQVDAGEVEWDDDGSPVKESLERAIKALLREHPALVPAASAAPDPAAPAPIASGAPTNAPRVLVPTYSAEQLRGMTQDEINAKWADIEVALRNGH